jgi:hypothetical protein
MDDTAQNQNQVSDNTQPQPVVPTQPVAQPEPQVQAPIQVSPQPQVTPVGSARKEVGIAPVSDYVRASEAAIIKDREVSDAGIVEVEKEIKLEEAHEKMGVRLSAESTPVKTEPSGLVQLPMDEKEAEKLIKKGPGHNINLEKFLDGIFFANSVYGLAVLMAKHLKRIHHKITGQQV